MTKREMFLAIREVVSADAEMVAFIDKEIDLLNRKSASRKPTKTQTENEVYKADILVTLSTADAPLSIKDIQAGTASLEELSNQRISHLMKALVDSENNAFQPSRNASIESISLDAYFKEYFENHSLLLVRNLL